MINQRMEIVRKNMKSSCIKGESCTMMYTYQKSTINLNFSFLDYYIGENGEVCHDASHVIRSEEECLIAVQRVGLEANSEIKKGRNKEIPSGCSINDKGKPHYEKSSKGTGIGHEDLAPICHGPLISGILSRLKPF